MRSSLITILLSSEKRMDLLLLLKEKPRTIEEINDELDTNSVAILPQLKKLKEIGIFVELIDVQTLLPFDIHHIIKKSIVKTNYVLFLDEDVRGGATAYMMQKVMEDQEAFYYLDAPPKTLSSKEHRPAYGTDGDYFSKPNVETIYEALYNIMHERNPAKFPPIYFNEK